MRGHKAQCIAAAPESNRLLDDDGVGSMKVWRCKYRSQRREAVRSVGLSDDPAPSFESCERTDHPVVDALSTLFFLFFFLFPNNSSKFWQ